jgi:hypothetical protein
MSDDASYSAFLTKANEPLSSPQQQTQTSTSTSQTKTRFDPTSTPTTAATPKPIATLLSDSRPTYTSETDAAFEPFFASYSGTSLPSADDFAKAAGLKGGESTTSTTNVEKLNVKAFDPRGQYAEVIEAVKAAGDGDGDGNVGVYRLEVSSTRIVYFVVTLADKGSKLVGVKVESVES